MHVSYKIDREPSPTPPASIYTLTMELSPMEAKAARAFLSELNGDVVTGTIMRADKGDAAVGSRANRVLYALFDKLDDMIQEGEGMNG